MNSFPKNKLSENLDFDKQIVLGMLEKELLKMREELIEMGKRGELMKKIPDLNEFIVDGDFGDFRISEKEIPKYDMEAAIKRLETTISNLQKEIDNENFQKEQEKYQKYMVALKKRLKEKGILEKRYSGLDALNPIFGKKVLKFIKAAKEKGLNIRILETWRSEERQKALYAQGRTKPGRKVLWTLKSNHFDGFAIDICFNGKIAYPEQEYRMNSETGVI